MIAAGPPISWLVGNVREAGRAGRYLVCRVKGEVCAVRLNLVHAVVPQADGAEHSGQEREDLAGPLSPWMLVLDVRGRRLVLAVDSVGEIIDVRERDIRNGQIQLRLNGRPYGHAKRLLDPEAGFSPAESVGFS